MKPWLVLSVLLAGGLAQGAEFERVLTDKSSVSFGFKQMGVAAEGRFRRHIAQVSFDPAKPAAATVQIEIELASVDTGGAEGDEEVRRKAWFDTAQFPKARFVSTAIKPLGGNRYEVAGRLSIKATTRQIVFPATFTPQGELGQFAGEFLIKRLDFKIGDGPWSDLETVANEVLVKFRIVVAQGKAKN